MREFALVFLVAAGVTYLLTPVARRIAILSGAMAEPRDRDVHAIATPRLGGIAMYGGLVASLLVAQQLPALGASIAIRGSSEVQAVIVAGGLICLLGIVDDRWGVDAVTKLAGQALSAGVLVLLGVQLYYVWIPGQGTLSLTKEMATVLTVLLTLLMVNSINFIDGLDGLAAGVVAIAATAFFAYSYQLAVVDHVQRLTPATLFSAALAGICVGFLPHNFYPARVFMGDSGSMLIGLLLAAAATSGTSNLIVGSISRRLPAYFVPILLPVAVLAVPFIDLLLAIIRRMRAGRPVFTPDKEHIHHRLLEIGHSHPRAVLVVYFWSALIAFGAVGVSFARPSIVLAVVAVIGGLAVLRISTPRYRALRAAAATATPADPPT